MEKEEKGATHRRETFRRSSIENDEELLLLYRYQQVHYFYDRTKDEEEKKHVRIAHPHSPRIHIYDCSPRALKTYPFSPAEITFCMPS